MRDTGKSVVSPVTEPRAGANPERRFARRGPPHGEPSRSHLVTMIEATYREMPGLSLYVQQAARLFGLRETTCRAVLDSLVSDRRLRLSADGQYRAGSGAP